MPDITISCTSGNDVEGLVVDQDLANGIWPGATDSQLADGSRDLMKLILINAYQIKTGTNLNAAITFVNQHTTETS